LWICTVFHHFHLIPWEDHYHHSFSGNFKSKLIFEKLCISVKEDRDISKFLWPLRMMTTAQLLSLRLYSSPLDKVIGRKLLFLSINSYNHIERFSHINYFSQIVFSFYFLITVLFFLTYCLSCFSSMCYLMWNTEF
jgi:hypothetical protein